VLGSAYLKVNILEKKFNIPSLMTSFSGTVNIEQKIDPHQYQSILIIIIIIVSLLMSPLLGHRPSSWITHKENGP
jgi:hypothetical protein